MWMSHVSSLYLLWLDWTCVFVPRTRMCVCLSERECIHWNRYSHERRDFLSSFCVINVVPFVSYKGESCLMIKPNMLQHSRLDNLFFSVLALCVFLFNVFIAKFYQLFLLTLYGIYDVGGCFPFQKQQNELNCRAANLSNIFLAAEWRNILWRFDQKVLILLRFWFCCNIFMQYAILSWSKHIWPNGPMYFSWLSLCWLNFKRVVVIKHCVHRKLFMEEFFFPFFYRSIKYNKLRSEHVQHTSCCSF